MKFLLQGNKINYLCMKSFLVFKRILVLFLFFFFFRFRFISLAHSRVSFLSSHILFIYYSSVCLCMCVWVFRNVFGCGPVTPFFSTLEAFEILENIYIAVCFQLSLFLFVLLFNFFLFNPAVAVLDVNRKTKEGKQKKKLLVFKANNAKK